MYQVAKSRKTNLQLFSDYKAWWSKEPQWENDCGSFLPCFLVVFRYSHIRLWNLVSNLNQN